MSRPASTDGTVTSLAGRPRYQADFASIASGHVQAARARLRMDHAEFADYLSGVVGWPVIPGVISRWEQGAGTPPGDIVLASAAVAQDVSAASAALGDDGSEDVIPYPDRGLIGREQWRAIIAGSREHIWLYGMAEHGYAADDEVPAIMAEAVRAGCSVRVLLLSPAYSGIDDIDAAEGSPPGTLAARISEASAKFTRMRQACAGRMELRAYAAHPTVSVVRGDGDMLITPYLRYFAGNNSPTFGIAAASAPKMFGRYARHFAGMWELAREAA